MAIRDKVHQLKAQYDGLKRLNAAGFFTAPGTYPNWDGYNIEEFKAGYEYATGLLDDGLAKDLLQRLSINALNQLINNIANAVPQFQALFASPGNIGQFQAACSQLDGLVTT